MRGGLEDFSSGVPHPPVKLPSQPPVKNREKTVGAVREPPLSCLADKVGCAPRTIRTTSPAALYLLRPFCLANTRYSTATAIPAQMIQESQALVKPTLTIASGKLGIAVR